MQIVEHCFGMGHTIHAVLRKYNKADVTPAQLELLMIEYNKLNGDVVPKLCQTVKIPVLYPFD